MFVGEFQVEGEIDVSRCKVKGEDESEGVAYHDRKRKQERRLALLPKKV
jgi:hypothetical protein